MLNKTLLFKTIGIISYFLIPIILLILKNIFCNICKNRKIKSFIYNNLSFDSDPFHAPTFTLSIIRFVYQIYWLSGCLCSTAIAISFGIAIASRVPSDISEAMYYEKFAKNVIEKYIEGDEIPNFTLCKEVETNNKNIKELIKNSSYNNYKSFVDYEAVKNWDPDYIIDEHVLWAKFEKAVNNKGKEFQLFFQLEHNES